MLASSCGVLCSQPSVRPPSVGSAPRSTPDVNIPTIGSKNLCPNPMERYSAAAPERSLLGQFLDNGLQLAFLIRPDLANQPDLWGSKPIVDPSIAPQLRGEIRPADAWNVFGGNMCDFSFDDDNLASMSVPKDYVRSTAQRLTTNSKRRRMKNLGARPKSIGEYACPVSPLCLLRPKACDPRSEKVNVEMCKT